MKLELRTDGVSWQVVGDDVIVLDLEGSVYLKLVGTGRALWEELSRSCTQPELVAALVDRYDVHTDRAAQDVGRFLGDLRARRLLVETPSSA